MLRIVFMLLRSFAWLFVALNRALHFRTSRGGKPPCPKDDPYGLEAPPRFELGIRVLQTLALPLGYSAEIGADYEARTRYLHLGKVALYQMS